MPLGKEELHLVAMFSRNNKREYPYFWGFSVQAGLYSSCLVMLNLRCLGIVFDLDETLIVANTMRSFEDRIEALQRKISAESDPQRISSMLAEVKRYQDDKSILKQYVENDQVVDNGRVIKIQSEVVPALSDNHQTIVRPLIRMQEKNIILTRINPQVCPNCNSKQFGFGWLLCTRFYFGFNLYTMHLDLGLGVHAQNASSCS